MNAELSGQQSGNFSTEKFIPDYSRFDAHSGITLIGEKHNITSREKQEWNEVVTSAVENVTPTMLEMGDKNNDRAVEWLRATMNRPIDWQGDVRKNGSFLCLVDQAASLRREEQKFDDSNFEMEVRSLCGQSNYTEIPPLLRRKLEAMNKRLEEFPTLPTDPKILRKLLLECNEDFGFLNEKRGYLGRTLKEDPKFLDNLSDEQLLATEWVSFTGDGVVEFLRKHQLQEKYDRHDIVHPSNPSMCLVTEIAANKFGVYDAMGRFQGMLDVRRHETILLDEDDDLRLLSQGTSIANIAGDTAFAFDLGMREQLSKDFGFPLEQLTLQEQITLVGALREGGNEDEQRLLTLVKDQGLNGARALLSTAMSPDMKEVVFQISETLPKETSAQIFSDYAGIADAAAKSAEDIARELTNSGKLDVNLASLRTELLRRGNSILKEALRDGNDATTALFTRAQSDIHLFATVFKQTRKDNPELGFDDLRGVNLESLSASEISPTDQRTMEAITLQNWMTQKPEVAEKIAEGLQSALQRTDTKFYLLRKDTDVAAFIRFDTRPDGTVYGASLNVNPSLRGSGIGESMMRAAIDEMAHEHIITADVFPELPVGMKYVEEFGCVITGVETVDLGDGHTTERFTLRRDDEKNDLYQLRHKKHAQLAAHGRVMRFDTSKGTEDMLNAVREAAKNGEVATRYYTENNKGAVRYLAFEPDVTVTQQQQAA